MSEYEYLKKKKEIAEDYVKGKLNPCHIIEKYLKTVDLTQGGYVPFLLFPKQKEIIFAYDNYRHNVVTKPRQTGVSTTTAAYLAVKAAFADVNKPEQIIIIANKFASAKKFVGLIRQFLSHIPSWVWGENYDHSKAQEGHIDGKGSTETIKLLNGTIIKAVATSPDALRGWTPTYLVIDEAAYVETYAKELYTASMASLITGGKMIIISTPNGKDELYYKVYAGAKSGQNGFNIVHLAWYQDPRYNKELEWYKEDENGVEEVIKEEEYDFQGFADKVTAGYKPRSPWYKEMCAMLNNDKISIARELDVRFEGSAGTVVEQEWISYHELVNVYKEEDILLKEHNDLLWLYEEPIAGHTYIMGVDVASGNADDFSSIVVIDTVTGHMVLEYKGKIRPQDLAPIVFQYGVMFSSLTVVDTTGGYGDVLILKLEEMEYKFLYYNKGQKDYNKKHPRATFNKHQLVAGYKIGAMRPQIIAKLTEYIENNQFKIRSMRFIAELETFVWVNGRPDHMSGFNDDLIFAAALALWILETEFKNLEKANAQTEMILSILGNNGKNQIREKVNLEEIDISTDSESRKYYRSKQDPKGQYGWLFN